MRYGEDTKQDVFGWLVHSSIAETKQHVSQASVGTLKRALWEVKGANKGKTETILRELFKRLEVGDDVVIFNGRERKQCKIIAISENGQYLKLDNIYGQFGWKDIEFYGCKGGGR